VDTEVWLPIATLVAGAVLGFVGEWLRDGREHRRGRERDRREWQRQVTADLIVAITETYRTAVTLREAELRRFAETNEWPPLALPVLTPEGLVAHITRCDSLAVFIGDKSLHEPVYAGVTTIGRMWTAPSKEQSDSYFREATKTHGDLLSRIGEYARSL